MPDFKNFPVKIVDPFRSLPAPKPPPLPMIFVRGIEQEFLADSAAQACRRLPSSMHERVRQAFLQLPGARIRFTPAPDILIDEFGHVLRYWHEPGLPQPNKRPTGITE